MPRVENVQSYRNHDKYIPIFEVTLQSAFTNQPTNDGVEILSNNASDTQLCTVWYTETGSSTLKYETVTLTGTSVKALTSVIIASVYGVFLGTPDGTISKRAVGTITVRKATGDAAITTIAATKLSSGTQRFYLAGRNVEVENIAGNTWIGALTPTNFAVNNAEDILEASTTPIAIATGAYLQLTGRMSKLLTVADYLTIASDVTGSTVQITVLA